MRFGDYEVEIVSDGVLWLDGGAMFGVVPKPLWEKKAPPDEKNRIPLGLNCLLIRAPDGNILVDTGCGDKYTEKERSIYRLERPAQLQSGLAELGLAPEDIDIVINTHLHFDHCGGNTRREGTELVPAFPNARYLVRRQEYEDACSPNERTRGSYLMQNWQVLTERRMLELVDEDREVVPGLSLCHTPGHTRGHQSVRLDSQGRSLFYLADLCPTSAHLPLAWIMGYDLFPLTTLETRRRIFRQAVDENWLLVFEHDPKTKAGYLRQEQGTYILQPAWEEIADGAS
jgi:glyoxylase-like metal-dependent hydrolase (beta-lactamase superfamily II)